jgi:hypothetical protein
LKTSLQKKQDYSESKNFIRKKIGTWFLNHPNLWTNSLSPYSIYRGLTGKQRILPNFIIIGVPKCGTTALYEYLIQHENVLSALWKEIYFFDRYYPRGLDWYRANFPYKLTKFFKETKNKSSFLTGESTPTYIHHPLAPNRIANDIPDVKLIILLRNPVDRAYSHYQMEKRLGYENLEFSEALDQEDQRLKNENMKMVNDSNYYSYEWQTHSYKHSGHYAELLTKWMKFFPKENLLILKTEEFNENPSQVFHQVLNFLDLPMQDVKYNKINVGKYSHMDPKIRDKLYEYFKPHNEKLYKLLDRNFNW